MSYMYVGQGRQECPCSKAQLYPGQQGTGWMKSKGEGNLSLASPVQIVSLLEATLVNFVVTKPTK